MPDSAIRVRPCFRFTAIYRAAPICYGTSLHVQFPDAVPLARRKPKTGFDPGEASTRTRGQTRMALSGLNPFWGLGLRRFQRVSWGGICSGNAVALTVRAVECVRTRASPMRAERPRHRSIDPSMLTQGSWLVRVGESESVVPPWLQADATATSFTQAAESGDTKSSARASARGCVSSF